MSVGQAGVVAWEHTSLVLNDIDSAARLYAEAFGYEVVLEERAMSSEIAAMRSQPGLVCDLIQRHSPVSGRLLELISFSAQPEGGGSPREPHVAFRVADLQVARNAVSELGAEQLGEVVELTEGRSVYCQELSGTLFELTEATTPVVPGEMSPSTASP